MGMPPRRTMSLGREQQRRKLAKFEKHIPLDMTAAAALSLRHAAAIDCIDHLVIHGDDVL